MTKNLPAWYPSLPRVRELNRVGPDGATHRITVVVPTRNEVNNLRPVLELAAPFADELLVVDGHSTDGTRELAEQCGAQVPLWLRELFAGLDGFGQARELVAATVTAEFCRRLYAEDVRRFHFYTLNRAELAYATCHLLGVRGPAIDMGAIAMEQAA